jgi:hypothetical protein
MKNTTNAMIIFALFTFPTLQISASQWGSKDYTLPKVSGGWESPKTSPIPQLQVTLDLTKTNITTDNDKEIVALLKRIFLEKQNDNHYWGMTRGQLSFIGEKDIRKAYSLNAELVNYIVNSIKDATNHEFNNTLIENRRDALKTFLFKLYLEQKKSEFEKK